AAVSTFALKATPMVQTQAVFAGQSLIASGPLASRLGSGSARFGIVHSNATSSVMMKSGVDGKMALSPEIVVLLSLVGYEEVGVVDSGKADGSGLLTAMHLTGQPNHE